MDKKIFKYFLILFAILQVILTCIFFNSVQTKNSILKYFNYVKDQQLLIHENNTDTKIFSHMRTLRNPIWEQMNDVVFLKRTSAFYIIERSLLRIFYVTKAHEKTFTLDFRIEIQLDDKVVHHIYLENATTKNHGLFSNYVWNSLNYNFKLIKYLKKDSYDEILKQIYKFQLYVSNSNNSLEETLYPIDVKLKYIRSRSDFTKNGSIVCSKCFWFKKEDYKDLFWWIELQKRAGYRKVIFCNNSIPNTKEFNHIFERNKDFVELSQLNFLPNFSKDRNFSVKTHNYLKYFDELGPRYHINSDLFNMMMTNECFLNNTHKYHHVAVLDPDEVILPRENNRIQTVNDNFNFISQLKFGFKSEFLHQFNEIESSCSNDFKNKLDIYLMKINKSPATYHFSMGFYLKERQANQIIEAIEFYFLNTTNINEKTHKIAVADLEPQSSDHNNYNFTFIIKNQEEVNYALNLCKIYRNIIQSFEKSHKTKLAKYSNRFRRYFYIGGSLSLFACGKSIHSTDITFDFTVHYPEADPIYPEQAQLFGVSLNQGHLAHFRHVNEFHKSSQKEVSITELILDLNYFNCYYKPIIENLSKIKLF